MVKVMAFISKRAGMSREAFIDHYENRHVPLICSIAPPPPRYRRSYPVRGDAFNDESPEIDFDVVTETVFPDREAMSAWIEAIYAPGVGENVRADEERFIDHARFFVYVVEEHTTSG